MCTHTHPMHFCTSAGDGCERDVPGKAAPTASAISCSRPARYAFSNGATAAISCASCSGPAAGSTPLTAVSAATRSNADSSSSATFGYPATSASRTPPDLACLMTAANASASARVAMSQKRAHGILPPGGTSTSRKQTWLSGSFFLATTRCRCQTAVAVRCTAGERV
eukprot:264865-Chlamydomonas_euryale.AAC.1